MITLLIINAFLCLGFYQACTYYKASRETTDKTPYITTEHYHEKGLLWFIPYLTLKSAWWIHKPLHSCLTCMAGLHSYPYWIVNDFTLNNLYFYPVYVLALAGINFILDQVTSKLSE